MSSPKAFLVGVALLVILMPYAIHCSVTFEMYKRFVDSNCLSLGQIAQDICGNAEAACLPVFELVEYCEEFCGRHTMNTALLNSAIMPGNAPRVNSTMCRYCARDPMGLTCHILTFLHKAVGRLGTTPPTTPIACGTGGSPGTCVPGNCSIPLAVGACPPSERCCLLTTTMAPTTEPACGTGGSLGQCVSGNCTIRFRSGTCPTGQTCCFIESTTTTTVAPTTEPACGTGGSLGQCVSGACMNRLRSGTCPTGQTCCFISPTTTGP